MLIKIFYKMPFVKIGIEKYDDEFSLPYEDNMTLEEFHDVLKKAVGSCKLNITQFEKKKKLKMKDVVKNYPNIFLLNNDNLLNFIKKWKGNFINEGSECFKDAFVQLVRSMAEKIVEKEEELRRQKGLPVSKNFKDYDDNCPEDSFWRQMLETFDIIKKKFDKNDTTPVKNRYDSKNNPKDQLYKTGGDYSSNHLKNLSNSSTSTDSFGLRSGNNNIDTILEEFYNSKISYVRGHEIYLKKRTVISDCINLEERIFFNCTKCKYSNISVINLGNINIVMNDFLKSFNEKSFNGLLKYYYRNNNLGEYNKKKKEFCKKCKTNNLEYYRRFSTLPEFLVVEFDLSSYYETSSDAKLYEDGFYWALQEEISLKDYYDSFNDNYSDYELTSFICHYGNHKNGHFINFSKIDGEWYLFDDLSKEQALKIGNFQVVKIIAESQYFGFIYKGETIKSKLKICTCLYEKNKCKGYENYVEQIKNIINKQINNKIESSVPKRGVIIVK